MHLAGEIRINNREDSRWPAFSISHPLITSTYPEHNVEEPPIYRSGFSSIQKELSYQASLMAGAYTLGPSDAPCLVETPTAHGDFLLLVSTSRNGESKLIWFISFDTNLGKNPPLPSFHSPKMLEQPQNLSTSLYGRHTQTSHLPTKVKLGFHLVGLAKFGPIRCLKALYKKCDLSLFQQISRSGLNSSLPNPSQSMCRFMNPIDRRLQLEHISPSLLAWYNNFVKNLFLVTLRDGIYELESLMEIGIMISVLRSRDYRSFLNIFHLPPMNYEFKQANPASLLAKALKRLPPDYITVVIHVLADEQIHQSLLMPVRISAMTSFSTSHGLLTVTIASFIASSMDDPSKNCVATCAKLPLSFCLKVIMDSLSNFSSYPFVLLCLVMLIVSLVTFVILANLNFV